MNSANTNRMKTLFLVTGVKHGSIVEAYTEDEAKKQFSRDYNGEWAIRAKRLSKHFGFEKV